MTAMCITKVYQPGKWTLSCLRYCSSVSHLFKTEAGGSTVVKETSVQTHSLDVPPVLFIAKYNRLIETTDFSKTLAPAVSKEQTIPEREERLEESNWSPQSLTHKKLKFILEAVQHTKTFESLSERLKECPLALFEAPPKAVGVDYVRDHLFADEEQISNDGQKSDGLVLKKEASAAKGDDLLHWTSAKLDLRKLPTYYMMLSKFRLTLLVRVKSSLALLGKMYLIRCN